MARSLVHYPVIVSLLLAGSESVSVLLSSPPGATFDRSPPTIGASTAALNQKQRTS